MFDAKALLKQLPITVYLVVAGITVAGGWFALNNAHQRRLGALNAELAQLEHANRDLRRAQDSLANAYRVDTVRLTKIRRVTDSLTLTVDRWKHDTVKVTEYVTKADSAIRVCSEALQTCEARIGVATRGWNGARDEIAVLKRSMPGAGQKWRYGAAGAVVGALAYALLK